MTVSTPDTILPGGAFPVAMASDIGETANSKILTAAEREGIATVDKRIALRSSYVFWNNGSSSNTVWVGNCYPALTEYSAGTHLSFQARTNTAGVTVNIDGLGPIPLIDNGGNAAVVDTLTAARFYDAVIVGSGAGARLAITTFTASDKFGSVTWDASSTTTAWVGASRRNEGYWRPGVLYSAVALSNQGPVTIQLDNNGAAIPLRTRDGDEIQNGQLQPGGLIQFVVVGSVANVVSPVKPTTAQMQAGADKLLSPTPAQVVGEIDRRIGIKPSRISFSAIGSGSTATAWAATASPSALPAYVSGTLVTFSALSNSASPTVNIDGLGAIPIVAPSGQSIPAAAIVPGQDYMGVIVGTGATAKLYVQDLNPAQLYNSVSWSGIGSGSTSTDWVGTSFRNKNFWQSGLVYTGQSLSNNGPVTINIDGAGGIPLRTVDGDNLENNQILPGSDILFIVRSNVAYLVSHVKPTTTQMQAGSNKLVQATPAQIQSEIVRQIALFQASDTEFADGTSATKSPTVKQVADAFAYQPGKPRIGTLIASGADGFSGSAGQWSASNGTLSAEASDVRRPGASVMKITGSTVTGSDQITIVRRKITTAEKLRGRIDVFYKLRRPSAGTTNMWVNWSGTAPSADPPVSSPANLRQMFVGGFERSDDIWSCLASHPSYKNFGTGQANGRDWSSTQAIPADIQYLEFYLQTSADVPVAERVLLIDQVVINAYEKPSIIPMFDGWYPSHANFYVPEFERRGLRGSSGSATRSTPATDTTATHIAAKKAYLDTMYAAGWDITQQGQRAGNPSTGYPGKFDTLASDIQTARSDLKAAGYVRGLDVFSYMFNARSKDTDPILAANGIRLARGSGNQGLTRSQFGKGSPLAMGCIGTDQKTSAQLIAALDSAIGKGEHLCLIGHDVVAKAAGDGSNGTTGSTETSQAEMVKFLDAIAERVFADKCRVQTPSEFLLTVGG